MTEKDVKEIASEIMLKTKAGYLATIDSDGFPQIRAIDNLRCPDRFLHASQVLGKLDDKLSIYISTNTSSEKIQHITKNKTVAVYFSLPDEFKGIMLQGIVEIIDDLEFKKEIWCEGWELFFPKGYTDPDFTILRIKPKYLKSWYQVGKHDLKLSD
ncbi:MAG TPA: pyridoxamine 5'-phosphate oxidase family protein [candidate division Zixibacteria bacterium]|nr:pyridoxamine 5'-phosphate oxidase family protein [candidate division Zixibacteria bacterium]